MGIKKMSFFYKNRFLSPTFFNRHVYLPLNAFVVTAGVAGYTGSGVCQLSINAGMATFHTLIRTRFLPYTPHFESNFVFILNNSFCEPTGISEISTGPERVDKHGKGMDAELSQQR